MNCANVEVENQDGLGGFQTSHGWDCGQSILCGDPTSSGAVGGEGGVALMVVRGHVNFNAKCKNGVII